MIVCLYVDDFVITGILAMVIIFKTQLLRKFNAKDLGEAKYVLGIEIIQSQNNISITQASYITNVINSLGFKVQHHFVQEKILSGEIIVVYCPTQDQIADILTKPLVKDKFRPIAEKILVFSDWGQVLEWTITQTLKFIFLLLIFYYLYSF